tara:strand:+ start:3452 stop:3565 length:114 start_codon:yes stop_codon:yes gene_type:complete
MEKERKWRRKGVGNGKEGRGQMSHNSPCGRGYLKALP